MLNCTSEVSATSLATIVSFRGECDISSKKLVLGKLNSAAQAEHLIVDLSEVTYLDSVILATIMDVVRRRKVQRRESPVMVASSPFIRKIFSIAGMDLKLDIYESTQAATRKVLQSHLACLPSPDR